MHVRRAIENDIEAMHRVRMSVRENQLSDAALVQPQHYRSILHERGRGWIAEINGQIAGFAIVDIVHANVWALFVDPAFERQGIGRQLHSILLNYSFSAGVERLWLSTDPGTRAEHFYRSAGWRHTGSEVNGELRFELARKEWLNPA